jgi:hypothetical protein
MAKKAETTPPDLKIVDDTTDDTAAPASKPAPTMLPDPYDLESLAVTPAYVNTAGMKSALLPIPVREKPGDQVWFRVHPDPDYARVFNTLVWAKDKEVYLAAPAVAAEYPREFRQSKIYICMSMTGALFAWMVAMPTENSTGNWLSSKHEAAEFARKRSIRIRSNKETESWEYTYSENPIPEVDPVWPNETYIGLINRAFMKVNHFIDTPDHEVMRFLRGLPLC